MYDSERNPTKYEEFFTELSFWDTPDETELSRIQHMLIELTCVNTVK